MSVATPTTKNSKKVGTNLWVVGEIFTVFRSDLFYKVNVLYLPDKNFLPSGTVFLKTEGPSHDYSRAMLYLQQGNLK